MNKIKGKRTYAVLAEGKCELWYFQMLKRNEPGIKVNILPQLPQLKQLETLYKQVKSLSVNYTKVFWIVDYDVIRAESIKRKKGQESAEYRFLKYKKELEDNYRNVVVIVLNPCLEFWFLLHFAFTHRKHTDCSSAEEELKKYLKNYEKTQKFFTRQGKDIYLQLKPALNAAIKHSKQLGSFDALQTNNAVAELYRFFEDEEIAALLTK